MLSPPQGGAYGDSPISWRERCTPDSNASRGEAAYRARDVVESAEAIARLQKTAEERGNIFSQLMEAGKVCSLGQISGALYEVGGIYRRNM